MKVPLCTVHAYARAHMAHVTTVRALAVALDVRAGVLVDGIAPEEEGAGELSREAMERIADAVIRKSTLADAKEQALADQLKHLVSSRLRAAGPRARGAARLRRGSDRAWLSLSSYPQGVIESLVHRILERGGRPDGLLAGPGHGTGQRRQCQRPLRLQ